MKFFSMIAATLLSIVSGAGNGAAGGNGVRPSDDVMARLKGTWLRTVQYQGAPRAELHFEGQKVRYENLSGNSGTAEYRVTENNKDSFSITFEYSYKVKRGNGRIVERTDRPELLFHVEKGRPILSERGFECDGRGQIIMDEYLRREDFTDGFQSELSHQLNDRAPVPAMMPSADGDAPPKAE